MSDSEFDEVASSSEFEELNSDELWVEFYAKSADAPIDHALWETRLAIADQRLVEAHAALRLNYSFNDGRAMRLTQEITDALAAIDALHDERRKAV